MRHLKAFHIFHVAAGSTSFTEAANRLAITHGAVSKQIKLLEAYLSQSLFERQGRHVVLTAAGKQLHRYTTQAFEALESGVSALAQSNERCLEVSCEPTLTMRWLMTRLSDFYQQHPGTDIRLSTAGGPVTLGATGLSMAIRRDDFDLRADYLSQSLVEEWVGPVCSPAYWQSMQTTPQHIKLLHSQTRPQAWAEWATKSGAGWIEHQAQQSFAHFYFSLQAAVDGLGMAIGSYPLVVDDVKRGNLIAPFGFSRSGHRYVLLSLQAHQDIALEQQFTAWIRDQFTACVPEAQERGSDGVIDSGNIFGSG
ncbi:LysR substrate-binding domain-containing protein [Photobacterium sp. TY1-4]|uniref:LysR substrate-binding domain-containing protein n=1 Tax=Photobacterium sp. TY1-4 TaxID=2899122 RepID=UPI0021C102B4|nr:LysR substrate-binding domain-containing protein [Photobacterium sp. TY1-4]UXI02627.1 LysR substrate-binding domain-containing protein [Photobacterium sp. TY1-4]